MRAVQSRVGDLSWYNSGALGNGYMRALAFAIVALSVSLWSSVQAASSVDDATDKQLAQLEDRYFGRSYDSDSAVHRAQRLEKLIFGEEASGDLEERIKNITAAAGPGASTDNAGPANERSAPD